MILRPRQIKLDQDIQSAWDFGYQNVMASYPTGGGKTVIFCGILKRHPGYSCVIAHRQEIVGQISLCLNANKVPHRLCCDNALIAPIVKQHMLEHGYSTYRTGAKCIVAGIDTLIRRNEAWMAQVTLWVLDEGHHLLRENKWGRGVSKFPKARGLAVTATPERPEGAGLGWGYDGLIDKLIIGPCGRDLIDEGHLSDYIVRLPEQRDFSSVPLSKVTGDFNKKKLSAFSAEQPQHVGDVVESYLQFAGGELGVTFSTNVKEAQDTVDAYNAAGVQAVLVTAKTPLAERMGANRRFRSKEILQLVNVDIFGEGTDIPALVAVSFDRSTASSNLYRQFFGRALRKSEGKECGIIIDHVGNFQRHGFPDLHREWTLERRDRKSRSQPDPNPLKRCTNSGPPPCFRPYEAYLTACPYCKVKPIPKSRKSIEHVEGDLVELDFETLAEMRSQIDQPFGVGKHYPHMIAQRTALKHHRLKKQAQVNLRERMASWTGLQIATGRPYSETCRLFYHRFGLDVLSAQSLGAKEAEKLACKIGGGL